MGYRLVDRASRPYPTRDTSPTHGLESVHLAPAQTGAHHQSVTVPYESSAAPPWCATSFRNWNRTCAHSHRRSRGDGDMTKPEATVRARGLGTELRGWRERACLTMDQVCERIGWSKSMVSRVENGHRTVGPEELGLLLMLYEVPAPEWSKLYGMARDATRRGWWETGQAIPNQLAAL